VGASRRVREWAKGRLHGLFVAAQRAGFDVLPRHFYSEVPDIRQLRETTAWRQSFSMIGVPGADVESQLAFVAECCTPRVVERLGGAHVHARAIQTNGEGGFGPIEADFLYAFVSTKRPPRILQIGCGVSTAVIQMAARDSSYAPELVCVEPYPNAFLLSESRAGRLRLIQKGAQDMDLAELARLGSGDLLFVDSSHTLGPAGEVSRIILEFLPRLSPGAFVHFHDILFPFDYPRNLLDSALFFAHESTLLHGFLAYNARFEIAACLSMLHYAAPDELRAHLPGYVPAENQDGLSRSHGHFPSSTYLRVVA